MGTYLEGNQILREYMEVRERKGMGYWQLDLHKSEVVKHGLPLHS